jgi:hypothetical protein
LERLLDDEKIKTKARTEIVDREYNRIYGSQVIEMLGGPEVFKQLPELYLTNPDADSIVSQSSFKMKDVSARIMRGYWTGKNLVNLPWVTLRYQYIRPLPYEYIGGTEIYRKISPVKEEVITGVIACCKNAILNNRTWCLTTTYKIACPINTPRAPLNIQEEGWSELAELVKNGQLEKDGIVFKLLDRNVT